MHISRGIAVACVMMFLVVGIAAGTVHSTDHSQSETVSEQRLKEQVLKEHFRPVQGFLGTEEEYVMYSLEEVQRFLAEDSTDERRKSPRFNSDEFVHTLYANALQELPRAPFGWLFFDKHPGSDPSDEDIYLNYVIVERGGHFDVYLINPETDEMSRLEGTREATFLVL